VVIEKKRFSRNFLFEMAKGRDASRLSSGGGHQIHVFVGQAPMDQAVIDRSEPATYHINYVATDAAGNAAGGALP
jgi:hypothetical protein